MKKIVLVLLTALLVGCGNSPQNIVDKVVESRYRVATELCSDTSLADKESVLDAEIEKMRDLIADARSVKGTPKEYFIAETEGDSDYNENSYVSYKMLGVAIKRSSNRTLLDKLKVYIDLAKKVYKELEISCGIKEQVDIQEVD